MYDLLVSPSTPIIVDINRMDQNMFRHSLPSPSNIDNYLRPRLIELVGFRFARWIPCDPNEGYWFRVYNRDSFCLFSMHARTLSILALALRECKVQS